MALLATAQRGRVLSLALIPVLALTLSACGGSGSSKPPAKKHSATAGVLIAGASCTAATARSHGTCTVVLTDASRYRCAAAASRHLNPATIAANTHCVPLVPMRIPRAWRPVLAKLAAGRICLRQHGLKVLGGAQVGAVPAKNSPVGLVIVEGRPQGIDISYYWTKTGAKRAATAFAASKHTGDLARSGQVTVFWLFPKLLPKGRLATVEHCAFA